MAALGGVTAVLNYIAQAARVTFGTLLQLPFRFQFIAFWLIGVLFLLFNANSLYGSEAATWTTALLLYLTSLAFVFSQTREVNPFLGMSLAEFAITFGLWAIVLAAIFQFIQPFNPEQATLTTESVTLLITHILVVAIGEELLFRFAIPSLIPGPRVAAQTISAIVFGFMHWTAYGGSIENLLFASALGFIFGMIVVLYPRNGLVIAISAHAVWNAYTLGFL